MEFVESRAVGGTSYKGTALRLIPTPLKSFWFESARGFTAGLLRSGINRRCGIRILTYHGVVERKTDSKLERNFHLLSNFRDQVRLLSKFRVIPLSDVLDFLRAPKSANSNACAITFDDGYSNTMIAAEILKSASLPFTVFVSTGAIGRNKAIWTVELSLYLLQGSLDQIELMDQLWPLQSKDQRESAFDAIRNRLKQMPAPERRKIMEGLIAQYPAGELQRLLEKYPAFQMLQWDEIRSLKREGAEIGSHGLFHEIHHELQDRKIRLEELIKSKVELEREIEYSCRFFAFPNGNSNADSADEVKKAGYELAVTTVPGTVQEGSNPYLLPRLESPGTLKGIAGEIFWNEAKR